ncbi:MAG: tetratricopeptide repeat protein, partial [Prosthecobacter sp.]
MALHQAAGYISEQRLTFTSYITEYEAEAASLLDWFESHIIPYERPDMLAPRPVLITWKTSFDKLDPDTRRWLIVFAHFAPDPIPEFLLDSAPDANDEVKIRHRAAKRALSQAAKYSLLTRDDDPPRFKLHRLVQQILRLTAPEEERANALTMGIQLFVESKLGDPQDFRSWCKWTPLQQHAIAICSQYENDTSPADFSWLLSELGLLLKSKSLYLEAEHCYRLALEIDEKRCGENHSSVAIRLNNLSMLLNVTNRLEEAESFIRRALQIDESLYGPNHPTVGHRLNNLSQVLVNANKLDEAEAPLRRSLQIHEEALGPVHGDVARVQNNLANLLRLTKRHEEAVSLLQNAIHTAEDYFGENHPKVAMSLNNLAVVFQAIGKPEEAKPLLCRALNIFEVTYGSDHTDTAYALFNLAVLIEATGVLAEAEPLMRRAFGIFACSLELEHPNTRGVGNHY